MTNHVRLLASASALAVVVLGDRLSVTQVLGGALVLLAVVAVQGAQLWRPAAAADASGLAQD